MSGRLLEVRRTGWDVALGILLVFGGFFVIGHAALATAVWVTLLGWISLIGGVIALIAAALSFGKPTFWSALLSGALLTVLGILILRNLAATAVTLTLIAGALFLFSGVFRIAAGLNDRSLRWVYVFGGLVSTALGLIVLFNLFSASFVLLGTLLGIELLIDGLTLALVGRLRLREDIAEKLA